MTAQNGGAFNQALWMRSRRGRWAVGPAAIPTPGAGEIVVRVRAVAVNPVDAVPAVARTIIAPWLRYPTVLGSDVAGDVVAVGAHADRFSVGDRILGHALSFEKRHNRAAEGGFQHHTLLKAHMASPIPAHVSYEQAAVVPLGVSTAACGLFESHLLALTPPHADAAATGQSVVVWGASTSVGGNAVQLAVNAGYHVLATASPHNFDYVRSLGAAEVVDYHSPDAVTNLVDGLRGRQLAGVLAIGRGSMRRCVDIAAGAGGADGADGADGAARADGAHGAKRVATTTPHVAAGWQRRQARRRGVDVGSIWGGTLADNDVGPAIYETFLPKALAGGTFRPAPPPRVIGTGLDCIPRALATLREGVSASKIVVTVEP